MPYVAVNLSFFKVFAASVANVTSFGFWLSVAPLDNHNGSWTHDNVQVGEEHGENKLTSGPSWVIYSPDTYNSSHFLLNFLSDILSVDKK